MWKRLDLRYVNENDGELGNINNAVVIIDDSQIQTKDSKIITAMILNKRHRYLAIIQGEQHTQITDLVQKMNPDYFFLLESLQYAIVIIFQKTF